jgi:two-component system, NtrC family, response regulator AtoC
MKEILTFLAVEDKGVASRIQEAIKRFENIHLMTYQSGKECSDDLYKNPQLIIFSIDLLDMRGSVMLKKIKKFDPEIATIFVASESKSDQIEEMLVLGARNFILKVKDSEERIHNVIENTIKDYQQREEIKRLSAEVGKKYKYSSILRGKSQWMQELFAMIDKAAESSIPVSLYGEAGAGKKLTAKTIHFNSSFSANPFVEVNFKAIPSHLAEAELFGTEKTFLSGEREIRPGKLEEAQRGTLFLKDLHRLSPELQEKLNRVFREKSFSRLGSDGPLRFNSRLILSSETNLLDHVNSGLLNEELYYRVVGLPIRIAPLRERDSDVLFLARHFLKEFCRENNVGKMNFSNDAMDRIINYPYPGNIRELKAVIDLASVLTTTDTIEAEHINFFTINPMAKLLMKEHTLFEYTRQIISNFMDRYDHDILEVSKRLDIGKSSIYRMKKLKQI